MQEAELRPDLRADVSMVHPDLVKPYLNKTEFQEYMRHYLMLRAFKRVLEERKSHDPRRMGK